MHKGNMTRALCLAAALAAAGAAAQTNVYKWTDQDGKVHFSDTPPPPEATSSTQKRMGGGAVDPGSLPYATQMAMKRNPVTLYASADCGDPCAQARDLLSRRGVPFAERDPTKSAAAAEALKQLIGELAVPTVAIGESKIRGFDEGPWQATLDSAGYLRTRLPGQSVTLPSPDAPVAAPPSANSAEPQGKPQ
jgi:glutaredoxin